MCDWFIGENEEVINFLSITDDIIIGRVACENDSYLKYSCRKAAVGKTKIEECVTKLKEIHNSVVPTYVKHIYNGYEKPFHIYYKDVSPHSSSGSYNAVLNKVSNIIEGLKLLNYNKLNVDLYAESILLSNYIDLVILVNPCSRCPDSIEDYNLVLGNIIKEENKKLQNQSPTLDLLSRNISSGTININELNDIVKEQIKLSGDNNEIGEEEEMKSSIESIKSSSIVSEEIGFGGYGTVYKDTINDTAVAVKCINVNGDADKVVEEYNTVKKLEHKNIVKVVGKLAIPEDRNIKIFTPYYKNGDLSDLIYKRYSKVQFSLFMIMKFLMDIVNGVLYIHSKGMIHRDLKPSNIFIDDNGDLLIGDFGLCVDKDKPGEFFVGTDQYMAPELWKYILPPYSTKSDAFAVGCILYEIYTCSILFDGKDRETIKEKILDENYDIKFNVISHFPVIEELIKGLVRFNPVVRFSLQQVQSMLLNEFNYQQYNDIQNSLQNDYRNIIQNINQYKIQIQNPYTRIYQHVFNYFVKPNI